MERIAVGYCGLSREAFYRMTPREVNWRMQADVEREERSFEHFAQLACWVLNAFRGKNQRPVTVRQLLRKKRRGTGGESD